MNAGTKKILLSLVTLLLAGLVGGCRRDVLTGSTTIDSGRVACSSPIIPIFQAAAEDTPALCRVYVKSKSIFPPETVGPRRCTPTFHKRVVGAREFETTPLRPKTDGGEVYYEAVDLGFGCQGTAGEGFGCEYEITKVLCLDRKPTDQRTGPQLSDPIRVNCTRNAPGEPIRTEVWKRDAGSSDCDVTFKLTAPPSCIAELTATRDSRTFRVRAGKNESKLITIQSVEKLDLECVSDGEPSGQCVFRMLTSVCKKD